MPEGNERDISDIPESVRTTLHFIPAKHMDDVLEAALLPVSEEAGNLFAADPAAFPNLVQESFLEEPTHQ